VIISTVAADNFPVLGAGMCVSIGANCRSVQERTRPAVARHAGGPPQWRMASLTGASLYSLVQAVSPIRPPPRQRQRLCTRRCTVKCAPPTPIDGAPLTEGRPSSRTIHTGAPDSLPRVFPRRQRCRTRGQPPDRLDRLGRFTPRPVWPSRCQSPPGDGARHSSFSRRD
jgi:hypothetical protein